MKAKDIKALEHLPAVIRALEALEEEQGKLRALMMRTGVATTQSGHVLAPANVSAGIVPGVTAYATTAATWTQAPVEAPHPAVIAAKAERAAFLAKMRASPERQAKLAQFSQPAEDDRAPRKTIAVEELSTMNDGGSMPDPPGGPKDG